MEKFCGVSSGISPCNFLSFSWLSMGQQMLFILGVCSFLHHVPRRTRLEGSVRPVSPGRSSMHWDSGSAHSKFPALQAASSHPPLSGAPQVPCWWYLHVLASCHLREHLPNSLGGSSGKVTEGCHRKHPRLRASRCLLRTPRGVMAILNFRGKVILGIHQTQGKFLKVAYDFYIKFPHEAPAASKRRWHSLLKLGFPWSL